MPYIKIQRRREFHADPFLEIETPGELNFLITKLLQRYVSDHGISYDTFNDIMGAITGAQLEFYRRLIAPYEDKKIKENGDVY